MDNTNHHAMASEQLSALLPRLAIQGAAELLDDAIARDDDDAVEIALRAYRAAMAMAEQP